MNARQTRMRPVLDGLGMMIACLLLAACGSATMTHSDGTPPTGSDPDVPTSPPVVPDPPTTPTPPPVTEVTLTGKVTFDRVPFSATAGAGLDYTATRQAAARVIALDVLDEAGTVLVSITTDSTGAYSVTVPANASLKLRMRAVMDGGNVAVRDNTDTAGEAIYQYESAMFSSGAIDPREQDLNAPSGWGGTGYTSTRAAAPFAILDDIYQARQFVLAAVPGLTLPALSVYWSPKNTPDVDTGDFDDDRLNGFIDTSGWFTADNIGTDHPGIYLLGDENNDTDEYDSDVVIGGWAMYYLDSFSRNDALYGTFEDRLDFREAYSWGWAFAFPLMVKGSSVYRDSSGAGQGSSEDSDGNPSTVADAGWYNPTSVASILYNLVDSNNDTVDIVTIPFSTLHATLVEDMPTTSAMTSIYPFLRALIARDPADAAGITALAVNQSITTPNDDFGTLELTNDGGDSNNLPLYTPIAPDNVVHTIHSIGDEENYYNALGNRRYFVLNLTTAASTTARIRAQGPAGSDPDIALWRNGELIGIVDTDSAATGRQDFTIPRLAAGTYVIEVYDGFNVFPGDPVAETDDTTIAVRILP